MNEHDNFGFYDHDQHEQTITAPEAIELVGGAAALGGVTVAGVMVYFADKAPELLDHAVTALEFGGVGVVTAIAANAYKRIKK